MARIYTRCCHVGEKHGRLTILADLPDILKGNLKVRIVSAQCDCGTLYESRLAGILSGSVKSCGCGQVESSRKLCIERNTTHGDSKSKEHIAWKGMLSRCYNKRRSTYKYYGARGILVHESWKSSYETFLSDMGRAPDDENTWSVGRQDNNLDYSPSNCVWEIWDEQARNRGMQDNNTSGFTGVTRRTDKKSTRWVASWHDCFTGKPVCKSFSVLKFGEESAKMLAVAARRSAIDSMNEQGAGYTPEHGLPRKTKDNT